MRKLLTIGTVGLAGVVTTGLMTFQAGTAFAQGDDDRQAFKREDDTPDVVLTVDDDDDDDTGPGQRDTTTGTGTNTNTNGTSTGVSNDRDASRGDLVRDLTNDGSGANNVDRSRHHTNDGTRHDTRG